MKNLLKGLKKSLILAVMLTVFFTQLAFGATSVKSSTPTRTTTTAPRTSTSTAPKTTTPTAPKTSTSTAPKTTTPTTPTKPSSTTPTKPSTGTTTPTKPSTTTPNTGTSSGSTSNHYYGSYGSSNDTFWNNFWLYHMLSNNNRGTVVVADGQQYQPFSAFRIIVNIISFFVIIFVIYVLIRMFMRRR